MNLLEIAAKGIWDYANDGGWDLAPPDGPSYGEHKHHIGKARAALLALADADLPEEVMEACAEAYEGAVAAAKEKTRAFWADRGQEVPANQRGVAPMQWLQPTLAAMLRAIAEQK